MTPRNMNAHDAYDNDGGDDDVPSSRRRKRVTHFLRITPRPRGTAAPSSASGGLVGWPGGSALADPTSTVSPDGARVAETTLASPVSRSGNDLLAEGSPGRLSSLSRLDQWNRDRLGDRPTHQVELRDWTPSVQTERAHALRDKQRKERDAQRQARLAAQKSRTSLWARGKDSLRANRAALYGRAGKVMSRNAGSISSSGGGSSSGSNSSIGSIGNSNSSSDGGAGIGGSTSTGGKEEVSLVEMHPRDYPIPLPNIRPPGDNSYVSGTCGSDDGWQCGGVEWFPSVDFALAATCLGADNAPLTADDARRVAAFCFPHGAGVSPPRASARTVESLRKGNSSDTKSTINANEDDTGASGGSSGGSGKSTAAFARRTTLSIDMSLVDGGDSMQVGADGSGIKPSSFASSPSPSLLSQGYTMDHFVLPAETKASRRGCRTPDKAAVSAAPSLSLSSSTSSLGQPDADVVGDDPTTPRASGQKQVANGICGGPAAGGHTPADARRGGANPKRSGRILYGVCLVRNAHILSSGWTVPVALVALSDEPDAWDALEACCVEAVESFLLARQDIGDSLAAKTPRARAVALASDVERAPDFSGLSRWLNARNRNPTTSDACAPLTRWRRRPDPVSLLFNRLHLRTVIKAIDWLVNSGAGLVLVGESGATCCECGIALAELLGKRWGGNGTDSGSM